MKSGPSSLPGGGKYIILLFLVALLYFPTLSTIPFYTKGEPREAVTAQQIASGGLESWILPRRPAGSGLEVASKPPLFHWLVVVASMPQGRITELAARLPSATLAALAVFATAMVGSLLFGGRAGVYGGVILTTNIEWLRAATTARVDMTVTALITLSLLLIYRGWVAGILGWTASLAAWVLMGLAILAKGPIGVILPAGILVTVLVLGGRPRAIPVPRLVAGLALAAAIGGLWYGAAIWVGGEDFVRKQILKENVFRFISRNDTLGAGHKHPFYYFLPALAGGFAPWCLCLPALGWGLLRRTPDWRDRRVLFLLIWVAFIFLFYSTSASKRSVYILPLYPPLALLVGHWWALLEDNRGGASGGRAPLLRPLSYLLCALFLLPLIVLGCERLGFKVSDLIKPFLHHKDQANLPIVRDMLLDNFGVAMGWGVLCSVSAWFLGRASAAKQWRRSFLLIALVTTATLVMVEHVFQPPLAEHRTLKPFVISVREKAEAGDSFVCRFQATFDYSIEFYFGRPLPICPSLVDPDSGVEESLPDVAGRTTLVLLWDDQMRELAEARRERLALIATSAGTDPSGRRHLVVARWKGQGV